MGSGYSTLWRRVFIHTPIEAIVRDVDLALSKIVLFVCESQDYNQTATVFFHANLSVPGCSSMGVMSMAIYTLVEDTARVQLRTTARRRCGARYRE